MVIAVWAVISSAVKNRNGVQARQRGDGVGGDGYAAEAECGHPTCQHRNPGHAKFCVRCGLALSRRTMGQQRARRRCT